MWLVRAKTLTQLGKAMASRNGNGIPEALRPKAERWEKLWGLPGLAESVTVEFSRRFRTSLGLCWPAQSRIRLAAHLEHDHPELLEEVFCHELAHVAVFRLHGRKVRPHGPEWKKLLVRAGFEPKTRVQPEDAKFPERVKRRRYRYEHRCPVCQARRVAGRVVRQWRCVACVKAGLSGELVITRLPAEPEKEGRAP